MKQHKLLDAIKKIAWGYIFLHINFNLNTINILPNWVAYILFVQALPTLGEEEESANLLKPLGILLGILEGMYWINTGFLGGELPTGVIDIITSVLSLYFHVQLLTNLAAIAHKHECSQEKKLLTLRTVKTILTTVITITNTFLIVNGAIYVIIIALLVITIWICSVIFSFKNELESKWNKTVTTNPQGEVIL